MFKKVFKGDAKEILSKFIEILKNSKNISSPEDYQKVVEEFIKREEISFRKIGQPLRLALLGTVKGAGIDEVMAILGVDEVINRVEKILKI